MSVIKAITSPKKKKKKSEQTIWECRNYKMIKNAEVLNHL